MQIKDLLDELVGKYNVRSFIGTDPVQFPRRFSGLQDIEISALLTSVITWGRRDIVCRDADRLHQLLGESPHAYIMSRRWDVLKDSGKNIHRTFFARDLWNICNGLYGYYSAHESLEELFLSEGSVLCGLDKLSAVTATKHLSSPQSQSPCKRTNLMLRWLVRNDGIVDMGVWKRIPLSELIIPLDVHVGRVSRMIWDDLPRTERLKAALTITNHLSELCPEDPCKYDFALFGFGEEQSKLLRR
ncbi:TIGR02757 family protein [uncultured Bacteroides sp.]|uniref:TIGR02757 family protein n=1 Tax=uncultured Bacteroides sp. TaxID=162156 RepID=UPI002AA76810|nr:TIGR02757 family protein [uncultured Bacteroides sp.]